jgi:hypothetical protein
MRIILIPSSQVSIKNDSVTPGSSIFGKIFFWRIKFEEYFCKLMMSLLDRLEKQYLAACGLHWRTVHTLILLPKNADSRMKNLHCKEGKKLYCSLKI